MLKFEVYGLKLPEIKFGDELAKIIVEEACKQCGCIQDGDIIVVTSKIISKAKGYVVNIENVKPSLTSRLLSKILGKPAWEIEVILRLSKRLLLVVPLHELLTKLKLPERFSVNPSRAYELISRDKSFLIVECLDGRICSDAGIDLSNAPTNTITYPPPNPDLEAEILRQEIHKLTGKNVGVVITDTEGQISRIGSIDIAIGASGIKVNSGKFAELDIYGKPKFGGIDNIVDEIAATAALLMGQTGEGIPVVIIRGLSHLVGFNEKVQDVQVPREIFRGLLIKIAFLTLVTRLTLFISKVLRKLM